MKHYNLRRNKFRSKDKGFRRSGYQDFRISRIGNDLNNYQRKSFSRNDYNPEKLLEKYNNLANEASSNGDKILSESYYQHAEHFLRVVENRNSVQNNSKSHLKDSSKVESHLKDSSKVESHLKDSSKVENYSDKIILEDKKNSSSQQPPNTEEI